MLDTFKSFFSQRVLAGAGEQPSEHSLKLAAAALLLEVSRADFDIQDEELSVVAQRLRKTFELDEAETEELVNIALSESEESLSLHPFVRMINENFEADQKRHIVEDMWRVAYADGELDKYEEHRIRKIAELLYVSHGDFIRAKLRVQESL